LQLALTEKILRIHFPFGQPQLHRWGFLRCAGAPPQETTK
jgi:hypothetical protein